MALPYEITFSVQDGVGKTSTGRFYINSAQTTANAVTEAEGLLDSIAAMLSGKIVSASMGIPLDVAGLVSNPATPDAQSNVKYKFRFIMQSAEGHETILSIPAADQSLSVDNTNNVNVSSGVGATLYAELITRPLTTSHDEDVTVVTKAVEVWWR